MTAEEIIHDQRAHIKLCDSLEHANWVRWMAHAQVLQEAASEVAQSFGNRFLTVRFKRPMVTGPHRNGYAVIWHFDVLVTP